VVRLKFVFVVGVSAPLYLANPSALVSVDVLNGDYFSSVASGGYIQFDSPGTYFVSLMALGTRAQPGLGSLSINPSSCLFFPMESFTFPSASNFSMVYLVEASSSAARFRPYIGSYAATQTIEFVCTLVKLTPDFN